MTLTQNNLTIRPATQDDAKYLCKHWNAGGWDIGIDDVEEMLDGSTAQHIIEVDGQVLGDIHYGDVEEKVAEIGVYIRNETYRGKGYGLVSLRIYASALFNTLGYEKIILNTSASNKSVRYICENKFNLQPIIHENIEQPDGSLETVVEYVLKKENMHD